MESVNSRRVRGYELNEEKLNLYRSLFETRSDVYAIQTSESSGKIKYSPSKKGNRYYSPDLTTYRWHLEGKRAIGSYLPIPQDNDLPKTPFICLDFDHENFNPPEELKKTIYRLTEACQINEIPVYIEISRSGRGYHVWFFFNNKVYAWKARRIAKKLLEVARIDPAKVEIFPKQDTLGGLDKGLGNLIALPLDGKLVKQNKTVFVDPSNLIPVLDQWGLLKNIRRLDEEELDDLAREWRMDLVPPEKKSKQSYDGDLTEQTDQPGIEKIISRCSFIQWCKDNQSKQSEPLWYAMVSNLARFKKGKEKIHEFSNQYPAYTHQETEQKITHALRDTGPHTCRFIQENGFDGCPKMGCGVRSPAALAFKTLRIKNSKYVKEKRGSITNFLIAPKLRVRIDDQEYLEANIATEKGITGWRFSPDAWISKQRFKKALGGRLDLRYKGTDDDIQDIMGILDLYNTPVKNGTRVIGLHKIDNTWAFVEQEGALDKNGIRKDIVFLPDQTNLTCSLIAREPIKKEQLREIVPVLFDFNDSSVVSPLLGWCFACFFKPRIFHLKREFPLLDIWGEKGSGKTKTLEYVVKPIFGITSPIARIDIQTRFSFIREIASSNLIPVIYDEYKLTRITSRQQRNEISGMIRGVYNNISVSRGRPDQSLIRYTYLAPVIISGEQGLTELAHKDRIIETYWSKTRSSPHQDAFDQLSKMNLTGIGRDFLLWSLNQDDNFLEDVYNEEFEKIDDELKDRIRENTAFARFGLRMFSLYLESRGLGALHEDTLGEIDSSQKENLVKQSNKSLVDSTIEVFSVMAEGNLLEENRHYRVNTEGKLFLHINSIYPIFKRWVRDYDWEGEALDKTSFTRQLREAPYFIEYDATRFGETTRKTFALDLYKMENLELEAFKIE